VEELGADFVLRDLAGLPGLIRDAGEDLQPTAH
jgi:hypothetical protein